MTVRFEAAPYIATDYKKLWSEVERIMTSKDPKDIALCKRVEDVVKKRINNG